MATDIYKLTVGELGGANDEIQDSVTSMSVSLTTDLTSEIRFTVTDPGFRMHNSGYFVIRRPVIYANLNFEVSSVEVRHGADGLDEVEVFCRAVSVQKMKRDKGTANFGKISPSAFAAQMAQKHGLLFFGEGSAAKAAIIRQNTEESQESTWDVLNRLASELEFIVFESIGMLYFASEEFIVAHQTSFDVSPTEGDPFYLYEFTLHRSDDEIWGADLTCSMDRANGVNVRPGMVLSIGGVTYFDKPMLITSVDWDVAASDDGLGDAVSEPVKIKARTLENTSDTGCETQTFRRGNRGDCVTRLQQAVKAAGFTPGSIDGIFGPLTEAAIKKFQTSKGLTADGVVGPETWKAFTGDEVAAADKAEVAATGCAATLLRYGSRGNCVKSLQTKLNAAGHNAGAVDGIFGSKTKAAVKSFQAANGLVVDGIVGPKTWAKLG